MFFQAADADERLRDGVYLLLEELLVLGGRESIRRDHLLHELFRACRRHVVDHEDLFALRISLTLRIL